MDKKIKDDMVNLIDLTKTVLEKGLHLGENAIHLGLCLQFVERLKKDVLNDFVFVKEEKSFGKEEKKGKKVKSA